MEVEFCNWENDENSDLGEIEESYTVICVKKFKDEGLYEMEIILQELGNDTECVLNNCEVGLKGKCREVDVYEEIRDDKFLEVNRDQVNTREKNAGIASNRFFNHVDCPEISEFTDELFEKFSDFSEKVHKYFETSNALFKNLQNKYIKQLFGIRRDYLYKKVTRGFLRHLSRLKVNILEKNPKKLNFFDKKCENFRNLFRESHEFYSHNQETFLSLTGAIKIVTLSNCYKYYSNKTVKYLFQIFVEMLFTCKLKGQLSNNLKIPFELECDNDFIWELRKVYLKDLLFLFQSTNRKLIFR